MLGFWFKLFSCVGIGFSWKAWTAALGKASLSPGTEPRLAGQGMVESFIVTSFGSRDDSCGRLLFLVLSKLLDVLLAHLGGLLSLV